MSRTSPFDLTDAETFDEGPRIRPLFTLEDLNNDEEVLKWLNNTYSVELKRVLPYREQAFKHNQLYANKGWYPNTQGGSFAQNSLVGTGIEGPSRPNKVIVNHLYDLVNKRVARVLSNPAGVEVMPAQQEYSDRMAAKLTSMWLKYLFYRCNLDTIRGRSSKAAFIMGESYCWVRWNPNGGPISPDWKAEEEQARAEKRTPRLPLLNSKGVQITGADGEPLWIEKAPKIGEVELLYCSPLNTIPEFTGDFDRSRYFFYDEFVDVDELKALYPECAEEIESETTDDDDESPISRWRNLSGTYNGPQDGKVLVRYFRHKPTEFLASGRWIVATSKCILENQPLDPREEGLHLIRLTDVDIPNEQRGRSFFIQGKALNAGINDMTSFSMRNAKMMSHPRWIYPKGSLVRRDALGNDITEIAYTGPTPPQIAPAPPMSSENMALKQDLKGDLVSILGTPMADMGKLPPQARSGTALQAMYEQDDLRSSEQNLKQAQFVKEIAEACINLASVYYEKGDERFVPVLGKSNKYLIKKFDPDVLRRGLTVRIANDNGLPTSKAVRFDMVMQAKETMPTYLTDERAAEILEWGNDNEVLDAATKALRSAQAENEAMLADEEQVEPVIFEDHITHWTEHVKELQDYTFKAAVPPEVQAKLIGHVMGHEMLMLDLSKKNPKYAVEVVKIPAFPLFYEPSAEDRMVLDSARTGNPLSLEQTAALYDQGVMAMLQAQMMAGGMPGGAPPAPGGPGAGQARGGFNEQTNGLQGTGGEDAGKTQSMAPAKDAQSTMAPQQPEQQGEGTV